MTELNEIRPMTISNMLTSAGLYKIITLLLLYMSCKLYIVPIELQWALNSEQGNIIYQGSVIVVGVALNKVHSNSLKNSNLSSLRKHTFWNIILVRCLR